MPATPHFDFIMTAYISAIVIVGIVIGWVMIDYRIQRRALADLEARGLTRRSAARSGPAMQQAKEDA